MSTCRTAVTYSPSRSSPIPPAQSRVYSSAPPAQREALVALVATRARLQVSVGCLGCVGLASGCGNVYVVLIYPYMYSHPSTHLSWIKISPSPDTLSSSPTGQPVRLRGAAPHRQVVLRRRRCPSSRSRSLRRSEAGADAAGVASTRSGAQGSNAGTGLLIGGVLFGRVPATFPL